jgi:hypothetical protein
MLRHSFAALMVAIALSVACTEPPEPIAVEESSITVSNTTGYDWKNLLIVVNDHYRGGASVLRAGGVLNAPVSQFDTGFGQRFPHGTTVKKVVVTADAASGAPVKLLWELGQQKRKR